MEPMKITAAEAQKLKAFHREHFPHSTTPIVHIDTNAQENGAASPDPSDLGFYEDGTRRTLTDQQIAMFRHSEIQRYLNARRRQQTAEEEEEAMQSAQRKSIKDNNQTRSQRLELSNADTIKHQSPHVDNLTYDEGAIQQTEKKFMWPILG